MDKTGIETPGKPMCPCVHSGMPTACEWDQLFCDVQRVYVGMEEVHHKLWSLAMWARSWCLLAVFSLVSICLSPFVHWYLGHEDRLLPFVNLKQCLPRDVMRVTLNYWSVQNSTWIINTDTLQTVITSLLSSVNHGVHGVRECTLSRRADPPESDFSFCFPHILHWGSLHSLSWLLPLKSRWSPFISHA